MARAVRPQWDAFVALGRGPETLELEIDDHERRAIEKSLAERRSRLIEKAEDTTLTPARRQAVFANCRPSRRQSENCTGGADAAHEAYRWGIRSMTSRPMLSIGSLGAGSHSRLIMAVSPIASQRRRAP